MTQTATIAELEKQLADLKAAEAAKAAEQKAQAEAEAKAKKEAADKAEQERKREALTKMLRVHNDAFRPLVKLPEGVTDFDVVECVDTWNKGWTVFFAYGGKKYDFSIEYVAQQKSTGRFFSQHNGKYSIAVETADYSKRHFPIRKDGTAKYEGIAAAISDHITSRVARVHRENAYTRNAQALKTLVKKLCDKHGARLAEWGHGLGVNLSTTSWETNPIKLELNIATTPDKIEKIYDALVAVGAVTIDLKKNS